MEKTLTDKQIKFCVEYLVDLNATQAAIRAGYSEKTATSKASTLLAEVYISERIAQLRDSQDKTTLKKRHDILLALEQMIFTSPADFCTLGLDGMWYLEAGPEIPDDKRVAIKSITSRTTDGGAVISKIETVDKLKAIDTYCRLRGWLSKDVNINMDARKQTVNLVMPDNGKRNNQPDAPRGATNQLPSD